MHALSLETQQTNLSSDQSCVYLIPVNVSLLLQLSKPAMLVYIGQQRHLVFNNYLLSLIIFLYSKGRSAYRLWNAKQWTDTPQLNNDNLFLLFVCYFLETNAVLVATITEQEMLRQCCMLFTTVYIHFWAFLYTLLIIAIVFIVLLTFKRLISACQMTLLA